MSETYIVVGESLHAAAAESGIAVAFVPAEADDEPALELYRALGEVALFVFGDDS
jgi:uroporphyrinogen-III synthase